MSITFFLAFVLCFFQSFTGANETHELSSPNATVVANSSLQEEKFFSFKSPDLWNYISRVKKVFDSKVPLTAEDFETFEKLELSGLLIGLTSQPVYRPGKTTSIWNLPQASSSSTTTKTDNEFYWSEIHAFFLKIAPEWNLASVLEYAYEFKDIDELTRSQFYDYYRALAFLKGNSKDNINIYHQMKNYEAVLNFVDSEKMMSNSSLLFLACNIIVDSKEISIRGPTSQHQNGALMLTIDRLLKGLFDQRLERQSDNFTLPTLKKVSIYNLELSTEISSLLYKLLSHNSHSISILEIIDSNIRYIEEAEDRIRLTNLVILRLDACDTFFNYLEFSAHSNYFVLDLSTPPKLYQNAHSSNNQHQFEYFKMTSYQEMNLDYLNFIRSNSNLRSVRIERFNENFTPLGEILSNLPNLQVLFLRLSQEMQFQITTTKQRLPHLKTLFIRGESDNFDWSLLKAFPALEYLNVDGSSIDKPGLAEAIKESKTIKSLTVGTYALFNDRSQLIKSISESQSIKNLSLGIGYLKSVHHQIKSISNWNFPCLFLDCDEFSSLDEFGHALPSMKSVRFLFIPKYDNDAFQSIKGNELFPNLKAIIFEKSQEGEVDSPHSNIIRLFQQSDKAKVKAFFKQLGCLSFEDLKFSHEWHSVQDF